MYTDINQAGTHIRASNDVLESIPLNKNTTSNVLGTGRSKLSCYRKHVGLVLTCNKFEIIAREDKAHRLLIAL